MMRTPDGWKAWLRRIRARELDGINQSVAQIGLRSTAGSRFAGEVWDSRGGVRDE
jgi:hypothetical protein